MTSKLSRPFSPALVPAGGGEQNGLVPTEKVTPWAAAWADICPSYAYGWLTVWRSR